MMYSDNRKGDEEFMGYIIYLCVAACVAVIRFVLTILGVAIGTFISNIGHEAERKEIEKLIYNPNKFGEEW